MFRRVIRFFQQMTLSHKKLQISEMQAYQNESSPQKYFMCISFHSFAVLFSYAFLLM